MRIIGTGQYSANQTHSRRNLAAAAVAPPHDAAGERLVQHDPTAHTPPPLPAGFTALDVIGLDRSIAERGVRIVRAGEEVPAVPAAPNWTVRTFRPLHPVRHPA